MTEVPEYVWAAAGAIILKATEVMLPKRMDEAAAIRKELREDLAALKVEVDKWKERSFDLMTMNSRLVSLVTIIIAKLDEDHPKWAADLRAEIIVLHTEMDKL